MRCAGSRFSRTAAGLSDEQPLADHARCPLARERNPDQLGGTGSCRKQTGAAADRDRLNRKCRGNDEATMIVEIARASQSQPPATAAVRRAPWELLRGLWSRLLGAGCRKPRDPAQPQLRFRPMDPSALHRSGQFSIRPRISEVPRKLHASHFHRNRVSVRWRKTLRRPNGTAH